MKKMLDDLLDHLLRHQEKYALLLSGTLWAISLFLNSLQKKPLLMGAESYYYLSVLRIVPEPVAIFIPLLLTLGIVILLYRLAEAFHMSEKRRAVVALLFISSPAFIWTATTISGTAFALMLALLGSLLLLRRKMALALLPFAAATSIDLLSTLIIVLVQLALTLPLAPRISMSASWGWLVPGITLACGGLQWLFWELPFIRGPFTPGYGGADLLSDLGGQSGVSLILLLMAIIGIIVFPKEKWLQYALLPFLVAAAVISPQHILFLTLLLCSFAAAGVRWLFQRSWSIPSLQQITIWIILLSLLFSMTTYVERVTDTPPTADEREALLWMREHIPWDAVVYSSPEQGPFIAYYAQRQPFVILSSSSPERLREAQEIWNSTYISATFPLLEQHNLTYIYLPSSLKTASSQSLVYLLKNEKFKMILRVGEEEVWMFSSDSGGQ